jgi:PAS domain S-box-containing protein
MDDNKARLEDDSGNPKELAFQAQEAQFQAIVASFPAGLLGVDSTGAIRLVNDTLEEMFGYSRDELLGEPVELLICSDQRAAHTTQVQDYIACPHTKIMGTRPDLTGVRKDGTTIPLEIGLRPVVGGGEIAVLAAISDLTWRKNIEAELRRSNQELEEFAYIASHDLQEPLRMVSSFAELLGKEYAEAFDQQGKQWLQYLAEGASRMRMLVRDLLSYSRVGRSEVRLEQVDMNVLVQEVLSDLSIAISESKAHIEVGELPTCRGDASQLRLLIQNLLANAIKFQPPAQAPRIELSAEDRATFTLFHIRDNGIGIESDYFEKIFQIFQGLHMREEYEGTGLGLAICKRVVLRHGGELWVESTPGEGSVFSFKLPK